MLFHGVPLHCINEAAMQYFVPARMIVAVLQIEGGKVGQANKNRNGTFDYGPMQVNSIWLKKIKKYGYTAYDLQYNPCVNVKVGTWILAQEIADSRVLWRGVGDYHSHTYLKNLKYSSKIRRVYNLINKYLAR